MDLPRNYMRLFAEIQSYIGSIVDSVLKDNKKLIIWGYGRGGRWIRHLIEDYDGRVRVAYIIDNGLPSFASSPSIYRSTLLSYLDSRGYIILSTIKNFNEISQKLIKHGYKEGQNAYDVYARVGDSYLVFLEKKYPDVCFNVVTSNCASIYQGDNNEHIPFGYSCSDSLFDELKALDNDLRFFDFGCGTGAAIMLAYAHGIDDCPGGVDINKKLIGIAKKNMRLLDINFDLRCENAVRTNIDNYNLFFFYNPFVGEVFKQTIKNIYQSFTKHKRNIFIAYGNPFEHEVIMSYGFNLYKQLSVDLYDPLFNIYQIGK